MPWNRRLTRITVVCILGLDTPYRCDRSHDTSRSKGKVKDKAQHAVILDKATSDKLNKDVQSYRLVTVATLVDRMKINGSLARRCIADLEEKGIIKPVVTHSKMKIYSMSPRPCDGAQRTCGWLACGIWRAD